MVGLPPGKLQLQEVGLLKETSEKLIDWPEQPLLTLELKDAIGGAF